MVGAIVGDVVGSVHEYDATKTTDFVLFEPGSHFTDDSVLTVAIARAILDGGDYMEAVVELGRRYPDADYGGAFRQWLVSENHEPYGSWGNGSAMRVSPVGWAFDNEEEVLTEARRTAEISHNHPEGIKGAQAVALAILLARTSRDKHVIRKELEDRFGYDLHRHVEEVRPHYRFHVSCQRSVPEAIIAFLDSSNFEEAVRLAVSLGGDADTLACITGAIAEAYYGQVPPDIANHALELLTPELREIAETFSRRFCTAPSQPTRPR